MQSDDVVNAGFIQGEDSFVRVQVVYDELAPLDDYEGVDITRLTRELTPKSPYELNLMRITVDGKPIDDPGRSSSDVQRCTDVALDKADIQFRFDNLESRPRLARRGARRRRWSSSTPAREGRCAPPVRFRMYANYGQLHRSCRGPHLRPTGSRCRPTPLAVARGRRAGLAEWQPTAERFAGAGRASSSTCCAPTTRRATSTRPSAQPLWLVTRRRPRPV